MAEGHCEAPSVKSRSQNRGFRTWISGPGFQALNVGFQDLDIRTWVSGPRKLSILRSSYLFLVTFLCVHRHFSLRPSSLLSTSSGHSTPHNANTHHTRSITLSFSRGFAGYLKISKIKKSRRVPDSSRWIFGFFSKPV